MGHPALGSFAKIWLEVASLSLSRFLCSLDGHIGSPLIMLTIVSKMVIILWAHYPNSLFKDMSFLYAFLKSHPNTYNSNIGVQSRQIIAVDTSTVEDKEKRKYRLSNITLSHWVWRVDGVGCKSYYLEIISWLFSYQYYYLRFNMINLGHNIDLHTISHFISIIISDNVSPKLTRLNMLRQTSKRYNSSTLHDLFPLPPSKHSHSAE